MGLFSRVFGPPSPDRFAQQVIGMFQDAGETRQFEYDSDEFRLLLRNAENDNPEILNLHNFYAEHCGLPRAARKEHLRQVVRGISQGKIELPDEFEHARPDIRIRVWPRSMFSKLDLQQRLQGGERMDVPQVPIGEHLVAGLVYDLPHSMRTISAGDLADWDVTIYEAMEAAQENLVETEVAAACIGDSLYSSVTGDNYDASRLLLPQLIQSFELDGDPIAMVPNRDSLFVTGSNDETGLSIMVELAEKAMDDPRPMVATPLKYEDDEWVDWSFPPEQPAYRKLMELQRRYFYLEYAEQKQLLDAIHENEGIDVFVASFSALQREDTDDVITYSVWGKGVAFLLPQTEKLVLSSNPGESGVLADWDRVMEIAGDLLREDEELYPRRFLTIGFPSDEQLELIGGTPL